MHGRDDDRPLPWLERMTVCREICPKKPVWHAHLGSATTAVGSFLIVVVLGKSGRFFGIVPALLFLTAAAWFVSVRHSGGGGG